MDNMEVSLVNTFRNIVNKYGFYSARSCEFLRQVSKSRSLYSMILTDIVYSKMVEKARSENG